jgi:hypothetical protein
MKIETGHFNEEMEISMFLPVLASGQLCLVRTLTQQGLVLFQHFPVHSNTL